MLNRQGVDEMIKAEDMDIFGGLIRHRTAVAKKTEPWGWAKEAGMIQWKLLTPAIEDAR